MLRAKAAVKTQSWCLSDPRSEPFREGVPTGSFPMDVPWPGAGILQAPRSRTLKASGSRRLYGGGSLLFLLGLWCQCFAHGFPQGARAW